MRISDWSSDVCSSDLQSVDEEPLHLVGGHVTEELLPQLVEQMFLQRVPNDVQPAGRQIDIERLGLQMEPFGSFEEAEMEPGIVEIGRANVRTPVTNAQIVCRILPEKIQLITRTKSTYRNIPTN